MTDIYLVITEDRHCETEAVLFICPDMAVSYARQEVQRNASYPGNIEPDDWELNEDMKRDHWLWYCRYSGEGDSVRVIRRELRECALHSSHPSPPPYNPDHDLMGYVEEGQRKAEVAAWQEAEPGTPAASMSLHEHLGMSWEEYSAWFTGG